MSLKAVDLRELSEEQLNTQLRERNEAMQKLFQLRHSKQIQPDEIKNCRKDIARIRMVQHENKLKALCLKYKNKKHIPKELRIKQTRALRHSLTKKQKNMKSLKQKQLSSKYPKKYFVYTE